jgi:hypothetical protein
VRTDAGAAPAVLGAAAGVAGAVALFVSIAAPAALAYLQRLLSARGARATGKEPLHERFLVQ